MITLLYKIEDINLILCYSLLSPASSRKIVQATKKMQHIHLSDFVCLEYESLLIIYIPLYWNPLPFNLFNKTFRHGMFTQILSFFNSFVFRPFTLVLVSELEGSLIIYRCFTMLLPSFLQQDLKNFCICCPHESHWFF